MRKTGKGAKAFFRLKDMKSERDEKGKRLGRGGSVNERLMERTVKQKEEGVHRG